MSHAYVVRPKVDKSGETEKIRYYGVPVTSGQVSTEQLATCCLLYTSPSPRDRQKSRMPSSA